MEMREGILSGEGTGHESPTGRELDLLTGGVSRRRGAWRVFSHWRCDRGGWGVGV